MRCANLAKFRNRDCRLAEQFEQEGLKVVIRTVDFVDQQDRRTRPGMFEMYRRAKIAIAPADWESVYTPMVKLRSACSQIAPLAKPISAVTQDQNSSDSA